ncbi:hypothetical protein RND81_02G068000 [Saponaria officinalis]|uniref:Uncharacterized protein n=1 Tax=Saponaria officinalis TaxID=3572 RepID=A0AAW1MQS9_SAPOF
MTQVLRAVATAAGTPLWHRLISPHALPKITTASATVQRRSAHARPQRALRLPREVEVEKKNEDDEEKKRSRNERKKEAREAVRWGMDLASFTVPQIKRILQVAKLEKEVFEAVILVKKLGPDVREGKRRQFNYIGKLLRDAQPDLLGALIQATKDGDQSRFQSLADSVKSVDEDPEVELDESESELDHEDSSDHIILATKWYGGFINKDIQISNEVYSIDSVEFDRQELRRLVRNVHSIQDRQIGGDENAGEKAALVAANKSLNRFLISVAKRLSSSPDVIL